MRISILLVAALSLAAIVRADPPGPIDVQPDGRGRAVIDWPRERPFGFDVWVVRDNWGAISHAWDVHDRTYNPIADGSRTLSGHFDLADGQRLTIDQLISPARVEYTLTNDGQPISRFTGLYWVATLPVSDFAGGRVEVGDRRFDLPREQRDPPQMGDGQSDRVTIRSADGRTSVELRFDHSRTVRVQDARGYQEPVFQLLVPIVEGTPTFDRGASQQFDVSFKTTIAPAAAAPATVAIDERAVLNRFDGIGGNFVYGIDDPTTQAVLDAMPAPAWARIPILLRDWMPADPDAPSTNFDTDGSTLRRRFELDRELSRRTGGNIIASIWYPPEYLFEQPKPYRDSPGKIPRERWGRFANGIVAYLLHLKSVYGVEPRFMSLNEPDWGVYVLQDGEELRDWIKLLGERFESANLRTRLLLGDVADLHRGWDVIQPALADPAACRYIGAIAYHPWSGQNDYWERWAKAAEQHGWPLFATEMGADGEAWHDGSFDTPIYALREATRYVEQLRDARTNAILEWEWTNDFPMARPAADGSMKLTSRGQIIRQLAASVPTQAHVVATTAGPSDVTAAALVGANGATVHVVRREAGQIQITGLPTWATQARVEQADPIDGAHEASMVHVEGGTCSIDAAPGELVTVSVRR